MQVQVGTTQPANHSTDMLVAAVYGKGGRRSPLWRALSDATGRGLGSTLEMLGWKGSAGEMITLPAPAGLKARMLAVTSLGERGEFNAERVRILAAKAGDAARKAGLKRIAFYLDPAMDPRVELDRATVQAIGEGLEFGAYRFDAHLSKKEQHPPAESVYLYFQGRKDRPAHIAAIERGLVVGRAQARARDLVNEPGNTVNPESLADYCRTLAAQTGLEITVLDRAECEARGMGAFLAVASGTRYEPRFVHMVHRPKGKALRRVALVGKALTFDSGGLCLKPPGSQATMKMDMGGSAAVIGTMAAVADLELPVEVHGILAATENMTGEAAYRTGDILTASNGKTIEVLNTDAEGRLTLADALHYACELKPDLLVDMATLTGAAMIALGPSIAAIMGTGRGLIRDLRAAGDSAGEPLWELPMPASYKEMLKSKVADISNLGGRWGGAITAGIFLSEFVGEGIPWAHIDIAGPCFVEKPLNGEWYGATGFPVRALVEWLTGLTA